MGAGIGPAKVAGTHSFTVPMQTHLAASATEYVSLLYDANHDFYVEGVSVIMGANVTGTDTNTTHINLCDDATEKGNIDPVSGVDFVAHTPVAISITAWVLDAGDHLNVQLEKVANGLLTPGGGFVVTGQWR